MKLTEKETKVLNLILNSEYHDGSNPINNWIWTDCVSDAFDGTKSFSGITSQLQQKELANFSGKGKDAVCCITQKGYDSISS
jgi:hypothetical protein